MIRQIVKKTEYKSCKESGGGMIVCIIESEQDAENYICLLDKIDNNGIEGVKKWMIDNIITPYDSSSSINSFSIEGERTNIEISLHSPIFSISSIFRTFI